MIPYIVGKIAPDSLHLTKGLVKYVPGRGYFRAVSSQNGDKFVTSPPPIVERVSPGIKCYSHVFQVGIFDPPSTTLVIL